MPVESPCTACPRAINAINGRYCPLLRRYVQHAPTAPCGKAPAKRRSSER